MADIFSHSPEPDYHRPAPATSRRVETVVLAATSPDAFDGFTDAVHLWWPVDSESVFGEGSHVAFLRNNLVEESEQGEELVWADIENWEAPSVIELAWTVDRNPDEAAFASITFQPQSDGATRVTIEFDELDHPDDRDPETFDCDWPLILARYARFMGGALSLD